MSNDIPLTNHCRVLIEISKAKRPMTANQLHKKLSKNLSDRQVWSAIQHLVTLGKVEKIGMKNGNQHQACRYQFNEQYAEERKILLGIGIDPINQKKKRQTKTRHGNPSPTHQRCMENAVFKTVKLRDQKIRFLAKLLTKVKESERTMLYAIIDDYKLEDPEK